LWGVIGAHLARKLIAILVDTHLFLGIGFLSIRCGAESFCEEKKRGVCVDFCGRETGSIPVEMKALMVKPSSSAHASSSCPLDVKDRH